MHTLVEVGLRQKKLKFMRESKIQNLKFDKRAPKLMKFGLEVHLDKGNFI
jgi:hypothetical protein